VQTFTKTMPAILSAMTGEQSDYAFLRTFKKYLAIFHITETWQLQ